MPFQLSRTTAFGLLALCVASHSWAAQPPKMKMTTPIPEGIETPTRLDTDQRFPGLDNLGKGDKAKQGWFVRYLLRAEGA